MSIFRKLTALCLSLLLVLPFAACTTGTGNETGKQTGNATEAPATEGNKTEPGTGEPATEGETTPAVDDKYSGIVSKVPAIEGDDFIALPLDSFLIGDDGTVTVNKIADGVYEMVNNAQDYSYESRSVRFVTGKDPIADYRKDLYAYMTVSFYLPADYATNKDLWVNDHAYMYISIGDTHDKIAVTSASHAGEGVVVAKPGTWTTFTCAVKSDMGDAAFGFFTECNSTIYFANLGINRVVDKEHTAALSTIPDLPANFHPIDVCEYDEKGNEIKRNMFPGDGNAPNYSVDLIVINEEHEMVQVVNTATLTDYCSRSARFMNDPIKDYRKVAGAYLTVDIWLPDEYFTNEKWAIDESALLYICLPSATDENELNPVAVKPEATATDGDVAVSRGHWVNFKISLADLGTRSFGFYTATGTHFYYANLGVVTPN